MAKMYVAAGKLVNLSTAVHGIVPVLLWQETFLLCEGQTSI